MATTTSYDDVLAARYGRNRNPWPLRLTIAAIVLAFAAAAGWAAVSLARPRLEANALSWQAGPRSVAVTLEVRGTSTTPVSCIVKAQDATSTDIGYRQFTLPSAPTTVTVDLPTLFEASSVTVLGCVPQGEPLRVAEPDFPPGVAIP